ncbi:MAG: hypothetical protein ACTSYA_03400 [Candidatus Kariarchaeaceae archaeon]
MELKELLSFKTVECPQRGGINFPCVVCMNCKIGTEGYQQTMFDNMFVETSINSAIISVDLDLESDFEGILLKKLLVQLSRNSPYVLKEAQEGSDISFYIDYDMVHQNPDIINKLSNIIHNFKSMMRQELTKGRGYVNKWIREAEQSMSRSMNA